MNKAMVSGRLTRDPDLRYSNGASEQLAIARFTVAVNRPKKNGEEQRADFISCVAFGRTAELIDKYSSKGSRILVEGRIQTGSYKNREGQTVYTTDMCVEKAEFLDHKENARQEQENSQNRQQNQGNTQQRPQNGRNRQQPANPAPPQAPPDAYYQYGWTDELTDEGLPFN